MSYCQELFFDFPTIPSILLLFHRCNTFTYFSKDTNDNLSFWSLLLPAYSLFPPSYSYLLTLACVILEALLKCLVILGHLLIFKGAIKRWLEVLCAQVSHQCYTFRPTLLGLLNSPEKTLPVSCLEGTSLAASSLGAEWGKKGGGCVCVIINLFLHNRLLQNLIIKKKLSHNFYALGTQRQLSWAVPHEVTVRCRSGIVICLGLEVLLPKWLSCIPGKWC